MNLIDHFIDKDMPDIPEAIWLLSVSGLQDIPGDHDQMCSILWQECWDEMMTAEYLQRAHHNNGTYDAGCRGPLCRKAQREHPKRRGTQAVNILQADRVYDPILEYFHTVIRYRVRSAQQAILKEVRGIR